MKTSEILSFLVFKLHVTKIFLKWENNHELEVTFLLLECNTYLFTT